jgi:hypothetical protein
MKILEVAMFSCNQYTRYVAEEKLNVGKGKGAHTMMQNV